MDIIGQGQSNGPNKTDIDVQAQPDVRCETCDGIFFQPAFRFKKISRLLTGAPIDQVQPMECYRCMDCGTPSDII